jgi:lipopolysaccharide export system protein LptA
MRLKYQRLLFVFIFALFSLTALQAYAQIDFSSDSPVEITADDSFVWERNLNRYVANGNVRVAQDNSVLTSAQLIAGYEDDSANTIQTLEATGQVEFDGPDGQASGPKMTYDLSTGQAVLTGENLRVQTETHLVTADKEITYNSQTGQAVAIGNAMVETAEETLTADRIDAVFAEDPKTGKRGISSAKATGNVKLRTKTETVHGNKAQYNRAEEKIDVTGNVRIERGPNRLRGARANVDLASGISEMHAGSGEASKVQGVFFPASQNMSSEDTP